MPLFKKHACREHSHSLPMEENWLGQYSTTEGRRSLLGGFVRFHSETCCCFVIIARFSSWSSLKSIPHDSIHSLLWKSPQEYTYELDVCFELMSHALLFANPNFARTSDDYFEKLATCHWFSIEFGLCERDGGWHSSIKAGLLSSYGELQYSGRLAPKRISDLIF